MLRIDTRPYALLEPSTEIVACSRCDRYTPEMVAKVREYLIIASMGPLLQQGMSWDQARIVCQGQLENWEEVEFERDV